MQTRRWWTVPVLAGCLLAAPAPGRAQEKTAPDLKRGDLDAAIYRVLRTVINEGADLYNSGDWPGCYRLYEGSLITVRPLLDHHPALQQAIDAAVAEAARSPQLADRAFVLRRAIDQVRKG